MPSDIFIGLGSNLGDRWNHLRRGLDALLRAGASVDGVSGVYETEPREVENQPDYLNAVVRVTWDTTPEDCLRELLHIEGLAGRVRTGTASPRSLDLDLLLFGDLVRSSPNLTIPHPRLHLRRFVLVPLCEIAPEMQHPVLRRTLAHLLQECSDAGRIRRAGDLRSTPEL